jgi:serine protease Do
MNRALRTSLCFAAVGLTAASCSFAQDPAPRARPAANRSIVIRDPANSYLGIGVAEIDAERAKALNLKEVRGVEVKSVDTDSPAAKAGLKESDVVLEYNGQRIEGTAQFIRLVRETPVDRQVNLQVWRSGGTQTVNATIGHRKEHFLLRSDDDGDSALTVEIPPMPPMPPMPAMPPMPEMGTLSDVLRGHELRSGMLGIECEPLGSQLASFFGVKEGVLVRSVSKDSAAEKAGMRAGDVVVKVDGEAVSSTHEITSLVRAARNKHTFPLVVVRDKKEVTLSVTTESATSR